jgi:hypothetical protein
MAQRRDILFFRFDLAGTSLRGGEADEAIHVHHDAIGWIASLARAMT